MAELIYHVATTIDNFIADPQGNADEKSFLPEGDHITDFMNQIQQYGSVLMGTNTYAYGFKYGLKPGEIAYKGIKHYVFSSSLNFESNNDVTLVKSDPATFVKSLKLSESKPIWLCGGGEMAGALLSAKLIDKLILKINPIGIGKGIRLFGSSEQSYDLELLDFKRYESGVLKPTYRIKY